MKEEIKKDDKKKVKKEITGTDNKKILNKEEEGKDKKKIIIKEEIKENYKKKLLKEEEKNKITLIFESSDKKIHYSMLCHENDIMENIGKKVFEQKPELKQYGNIFIYIGGSYDENKTLKENNVKNQDKFVIYNKENIMKERERRKLNDLAKFLEKEKKIDVIISAEDTIDLILIKFVIDKSIKCIILCKENDIFNVIINKIYEKYPTYNNINNYFISNNSIVNEYKSLKENNIKKGDCVILVEFRGNTVNFVYSFTNRNLKEEMDKLKYLAQELKEEKKLM